MVEKRNYLSLFTGKDKSNNSEVDYLQSFISRGGDVNNLNKTIDNKVNVLSMLSEALREVGKNAPNYTQPQSIPGSMVSGFYVPSTTVKKSPFITMLNIVKDGTNGALNNAYGQIENINQAETLHNILSKEEEQAKIDREDKDRAFRIEEEKNRILENKSKLDANKKDALSQARVAKYEADTEKSKLASKEIEFKHDKNKQEQLAHLKRFINTADHIYDNLSQMDHSYFGTGTFKVLKRKYSQAQGGKDAQHYANLEQIKNNDIPAILKGIGGGNMLVDEKIIKGLLSVESTKANNAKNMVELLEESVNKIPQNLKEAHPELMKEFSARIDKLKSLYDKTRENIESEELDLAQDERLKGILGK